MMQVFKTYCSEQVLRGKTSKTLIISLFLRTNTFFKQNREEKEWLHQNVTLQGDQAGTEGEYNLVTVKILLLQRESFDKRMLSIRVLELIQHNLFSFSTTYQQFDWKQSAFQERFWKMKMSTLKTFAIAPLNEILCRQKFVNAVKLFLKWANVERTCE